MRRINDSKSFRQKKSLGQHFLNDYNIVKKIVKIAAIKPDEKVWEIGPGKGILTREILRKTSNLTCFEIDKELIPYLKNSFGDSLRIINDDVLLINWDEFVSNENIKLVANLPYQITTPLLFKIITYYKHFSKIVIMIQKEVAERLKAVPKTKQYSQLSLKIQF